MSWISLGEFELTSNWVFSESVEGEIFRILHRPINNLPNNSLRGVIAQGFKSASDINKFNPKLFVYGGDYEIFTFYFPVGISEHSIILKRLDKNLVSWKVEAQVFKADNPVQDYQNYILSRFGKEAIHQFHQSFNMALYPMLFSGSTTPRSSDKSLSANKPVKILSENDSRTQLRIFSTGQPVLLATGFNETGQPLEIISKLPPNYNFEEVISSAGMYKGDIYALSAENTNITVIEFSAK